MRRRRTIGSTRSVWDELGARTGKYEYTPFGGKYADHGDDITRKFTGHDWDSASRLYYTAYPYYSPDANRWLTRDPLGMVDGPNVYAYVVNNPVGLWDALGQCGTNAQTLPGGGGGSGEPGAGDVSLQEALGLGLLATAAYVLCLLLAVSAGTALLPAMANSNTSLRAQADICFKTLIYTSLVVAGLMLASYAGGGNVFGAVATIGLLFKIGIDSVSCWALSPVTGLMVGDAVLLTTALRRGALASRACFVSLSTTVYTSGVAAR